MRLLRVTALEAYLLKAIIQATYLQMLGSLSVLAHNIFGLLFLLDFLLHHLENIHRCRTLVFLFTEHLSQVLSLVVRVRRLSRLLANVLLVLFSDSFLVYLLFEMYLLRPS